MKIKGVELDNERYSHLSKYSHEIRPFSGVLVGKDEAIEAIFATYGDPLVSNSVLLAPPGTGKTTLIKGLAYRDKKRHYIEAELSEMVTGLRDNSEMGSVMKRFFDEVLTFQKENHVDLVVFIDEFHELVRHSDSATEALKPILAESGNLGLRLVFATTYEEFREYIMPNQALVERLQRVSLPQPRHDDVIRALEGLAKDNHIFVDKRLSQLFDRIYDVTEKFIPSANQPRKSLLTFSRMLGYHREHGRKLDYDLLSYVMRTSHNIEIDMTVDLVKMEQHLRSRVLNQTKAIDAFMDSIAMSVMRMNDENRPRGSWLLPGATGVGKTELVKQAASFLMPDPNAFIRFDMTEYVNENSVDRFRKLVTTRMWEYPFSILLFDEIEKAHGNVVRLLMQILDDGRLVDEYDRVVTFSNAFIFGTTNLGSEIFENQSQYGLTEDGEAKHARSYDKNVKRSIVETGGKNSFPSELVNRFDEIVPFETLQRDTLISLFGKNLQHILQRFYDEHGVIVNVTNDVVEQYIGHDIIKTDTLSGGGRQVRNILKKYITMPVSKYICLHPETKRLELKLEGRTRYGNKSEVDSTAYIKIVDKS